jgi:hypothetical protein
VPGKIFSVDWDRVRKAASPSSPVTQTAVPSKPRADPYSDDPFFKRNPVSTWNACIGKQGYEEHYIDGYIEAAMELAGAVIDKKMYEKRDTLVLPILYNARHAVELALKFATDRLVEAALIQPGGRRNHDLKAYWERLHGASLGDEKLLQIIQALKAFINSLSRIDNDGQELRYHLNRSNDPSLSAYSLANLEVIRASLSDLSEILSVLRNRALTFIDERETGTFTNRCSRRDLLTIAQSMPGRDFWTGALFDQQKDVVKARFNLSNRQFSKALDAIQGNCEMKAIIGVETDLLHTSDDEVVWIVDQWRRLHPEKNEGDAGPEIRSGREFTIDVLWKDAETWKEVLAEIEMRITGDKLAEIEAMFYLGRDRWFTEYYERRIERARREHIAANDPIEEIVHLMDKTNFLHCVQVAARRLGRLSLAHRLSKM